MSLRHPVLCEAMKCTLRGTLLGKKCTGWRRLIGSLIFIGHFPQKSPIIGGFFAKNDLQLRGSYDSSPPCTLRGTEIASWFCEIRLDAPIFQQILRSGELLCKKNNTTDFWEWLPDTPAAAQAAAPSAAAKAGRACGKCSQQSFILTSELNSCAAEWELAILKNEKY